MSFFLEATGFDVGGGYDSGMGRAKGLPSFKQLTGWTRSSIFGGSDSNTAFSDFPNPFKSKTPQDKTNLIIRLSENEQDSYHERKAILEYDAHIDREQAEWMALEMIYNRRKGFHGLIFTTRP